MADFIANSICTHIMSQSTLRKSLNIFATISTPTHNSEAADHLEFPSCMLALMKQEDSNSTTLTPQGTTVHGEHMPLAKEASTLSAHLKPSIKKAAVFKKH